MSVRSICTQGAPPIVTINMSPDATNANRAIIYDPTVQAYIPGDPIIGETDAPKLTLAGNTVNTGAVTLTATKCLVPGLLRLVTLQFPATVTGATTTAAAASFTGNLLAEAGGPSDLTPVTAVQTSVNLIGATKLVPAILTISTAGLVTITSREVLVLNEAQTIGFTVTYVAKAAPV